MSLEFEEALNVSHGTHVPTINFIAKELGAFPAEVAMAILCHEAGPLPAAVLSALTGHSPFELTSEDGFLSKAVHNGLIEPVRLGTKHSVYFRLHPSLESRMIDLLHQAEDHNRQICDRHFQDLQRDREAVAEIHEALSKLALDKDRLPYANNMGVMRFIARSTQLSSYEAQKLIHLIEDGGLIGSTRTDIFRRPSDGYIKGAMRKLVSAGHAHRCAFIDDHETLYYPSQHLLRWYERTLSTVIDDYLSFVRRLVVSAGRTNRSLQQGTPFARTLKAFLSSPPVSEPEQQLGLRVASAGAHIRQMASMTSLSPSQMALVIAAAEIGEITPDQASELSGFLRVPHRHGDRLSHSAQNGRPPWLVTVVPESGLRSYRFNEERATDLARLVVQADAEIRAFKAQRLERARSLLANHPLSPAL